MSVTYLCAHLCCLQGKPSCVQRRAGHPFPCFFLCSSKHCPGVSLSHLPHIPTALLKHSCGTLKYLSCSWTQVKGKLSFFLKEMAAAAETTVAHTIMKSEERSHLAAGRFSLWMNTLGIVRGNVCGHMYKYMSVWVFQCVWDRHSQKTRKHHKSCREASECKLKVLYMMLARKTLETLHKETTFCFWISSALKEIVRCTPDFQINKIAATPNSSSSSPPAVMRSLQDLDIKTLGNAFRHWWKLWVYLLIK